MTHVHSLIVGAGPTGLGAAWQLHRDRHPSWAILEASDRVGGLAGSVTDDADFTYDIGGHVLFSSYDRHRQAIEGALGDAYEQIDRRAWVWMQDRYVPYPFQLHVGSLEPQTTLECVAGLVAARQQFGGGAPPEGDSFAAWIDATFGDGIARHFMRPYNRKVWATPLEDMAAGWIAERVATVDVDRVLRNVVLGENATDWGPNATFRYPSRGGTGAIYDALAAPVADRIHLRTRVVEVDPVERRVRTADGRCWRYDRLLSTMPLDDLARSCRGAPSAVVDAAVGLRSIGTVVVGIGVDRPTTTDHTWIYYPEVGVPFHRVTILSNYSPHMTARPGQTLLLTETSCAPGRRIDVAAAEEQTIRGLTACGLLDLEDRDRIVTTWVHHAPKTYPVPTLDRDARLSIIEPWLDHHGIANRGRLGTWRYEIGNMDHAFEMGAQWVDHGRSGETETVWQPV